MHPTSSEPWTSEAVFYLNGKKFTLNHLPFSDFPNLLAFLRSPGIGLTGSKLGCGEGGCGACTVMISFYSKEDDRIIHRSVNGCLFPLCSIDGLAITTIEGIGSTYSQLAAVQKSLSENHGSQCGFCTPGIVMSIYSFLRNHPKANARAIERSLDGNLCRCTGYRPILDATRALVNDSKGGCCQGSCEGCPCKTSRSTESEAKEHSSVGSLDDQKKNYERHHTELIFPPSLKTHPIKALLFQDKGLKWYRPTSLHQLFLILKEDPNAKIVVGNTEVGIETRFRNFKYSTFVSTTHIDELNKIEVIENFGVRIGGSVPLSVVEEFLVKHKNQIPKWKARVFDSVIEQLRWFAGSQIRNVACLAGNIANASPISDLNPIFLASNTHLNVGSYEGERRISMLQTQPNGSPPSTFFVAYKKTALKPSEVILSIDIPYSKEFQFVKAFKQARRKEDDIAIVTACFSLTLRPPSLSSGEPTEEELIQQAETCVVEDAVFAFGGMAIVTKLVQETGQFLIGKQWNDQTLEQLYPLMEKDLPLEEGAPGGMILFRRSLTTSFLFKFFLSTQLELPLALLDHHHHHHQNHHQDNHKHIEIQKSLENRFAREKSAVYEEERPLHVGTQVYQEDQTQVERQGVGVGVKHLSSEVQNTGQALYVDDIPNIPHTLYAVLVQANTIPNSKILKIDETKALEYDESIVGFVSGQEDGLKGFKWGVAVQDEFLFADSNVDHFGQPVGVLLGTSFPKLLEARFLVDIQYLPPSTSFSSSPSETNTNEKPILTIQEAIERNSFFAKPFVLEKGDVQAAFKNAAHVLEGNVHVGGQEHFYLEPQSVYVIPSSEHNELLVWSSTQCPSDVQHVISKLLHIPNNRIVVKAKRIGGGFGGKETRASAYAAMAAYCAKKLSRPVKLILERDVDMSITGGRNPYFANYKIATDSQGKIEGFEISFYANGGCSLDLSQAVSARVFWNADASYKISSNFKVQVYTCRTHLPSNTAFRGFGVPQVTLIAENWIAHIATVVKRPTYQVQELNLLSNTTPIFTGELIDPENRIFEIFHSLKTSSQFEQRLEQVRDFNSRNKFRKRGISIMPLRYGLAFPLRFLNQATALVMCYTDGSVLVSHGGIEMGQGLHTKLLQIAATTLQIPLSNIHLTETSTDKIPNASPTAASIQADLNGEAVMNACLTLNERLKPIREKLGPKATFAEICSAAYFAQISLTATGFCQHEDIDWNWETMTGRPSRYYSFGAGCTEVEIDCLTGDHWIVRTDLLVDVGKSLNPVLDIGQIEGAFVQGLGWVTMEELVWSSTDGRLLTKGPGTYKIPTAADIPHDFRVSLLKNSNNPKVVYSSKGVGEPPLCLSVTVFSALREAVRSYRVEELKLADDWFEWNSPATAERIRTACQDRFVEQFRKRN